MCLSLVIRSPTSLRNLNKYAYHGEMLSVNQTILLLSKYEIYTLVYTFPRKLPITLYAVSNNIYQLIRPHGR